MIYNFDVPAIYNSLFGKDLKVMSFKEDMEYLLNVRYYRHCDNNYEFDKPCQFEDNWRVRFMWFAYNVPTLLLTLDWLINCLKPLYVPLSQLFVVAFYLVNCVFWQLIDNMPSLIHSLNLFCHHDISYFYEKKYLVI